MPGDPDLPGQAWDFPPWQAARLVSGAAQDAAHAWTQPLPAAAILDVTWDLHRTFRDLGIALWRLSRFQHDAEPETQPDDQQHGPGSHFYRAGGATISAGAVLRDSEVLQHVRRTITLGLPVGGRPGQGAPAIAAALELADANVPWVTCVAALHPFADFLLWRASPAGWPLIACRY